MNETVLIVLLVLLVLVLLLQFIVLSRLGKMARWLKLQGGGQEEVRVVKDRTQEASKGNSLFDQFIAEDRKRLMLSKREQAAAFRDWRKARGVTWQGGEDE